MCHVDGVGLPCAREQVTTLLKPDTAAGHNGTYMKGIALLHKNGRVLIETGADYEDDIVGEPLI